MNVCKLCFLNKHTTFDLIFYVLIKKVITQTCFSLNG